MKIGDLVKDLSNEDLGIIISKLHFGDMYHNGDKTDWNEFGVLYMCGQIFGTDKCDLEVLSEGG